MSADIDIDFADYRSALTDLPHVRARSTDGSPHPSSFYFHDIPADPLDGMAVWDHKVAEDKGYYKVDFLSNTIYRGVKDEAHLVDLLVRDTPWEKLVDPDILAKLAQIHDPKHLDVMQTIQPQSVEDLAVCLALIRPAKKYLIGRPRAEIDRELWVLDKDKKFQFKRSHAIAYAASIVVQLNLLIEQTYE